MAKSKFDYKSRKDLEKRIEELDIEIGLSDNLDEFSKELKVGSKVLSNRIALQPMEGCDGIRDDNNPKINGAPSKLTIRRYERFAKGKASLIWFEATAVKAEGRANPNQLMITKDNIDKYKEMIQMIKNNSTADKEPLVIMQLTHSGRFSKPSGKFEPIIMYKNPHIDKIYKNEDIAKIITDKELDELQNDFVNSAKLAQEAGFDGVDIKACHRYLLSSSLSAYTREGKYGQSYENRTRMIKETFRKIRDNTNKDFIVTSRMNVYDGLPYPYGWGCDKEDPSKMDLREPIKLINELKKEGLLIINISLSSPYYFPHQSRPYDQGGYEPPENQLIGVERFIKAAKEIKKNVQDVAVVGSGYSYLRHYSKNLGAWALENNMVSMVGYGREAFAYPDFPKDILENKMMDKKKCCIACSKCSQIMRAGGTPGCVIRDSEVYMPIYNKYVKKGE